MSKGQGQKVNRKQLADVFGISLPTVDAWVRSGCPFDQKGDRGREWVFDTADVMRWREQLARDDSGGQDAQDEAQLKRRKQLAEARSAELDLLERMGAVADIGVMERAWARVLAELQSSLRGAFITRCESQLLGETDGRAFKRILLGEVDSALEILADMDLSDPDDSEGDEEPGADAG
jgi:phage terminase Nu1 subunit (DNA packaging protein)